MTDGDIEMQANAGGAAFLIARPRKSLRYDELDSLARVLNMHSPVWLRWIQVARHGCLLASAS